MKEDLEKRLLSALEAEPVGYYEHDLSGRIINRIQSREKVEQKKMAVFYILTISVFLVLGIGGLIYFLGFEKIKEMQNILFTGIFTGVFILLVQWLDYKLIKSKKSLIAGTH